MVFTPAGSHVEELSTILNIIIVFRRAGVALGKKVLICGAGPIGLVNLLTARAMGASEIVITDLADNRLEMARAMGATHTYKVGGGKTAEQMAEEVADLLGGDRPDVTIECSGAEPSIRWYCSSTLIPSRTIAAWIIEIALDF